MKKVIVGICATIMAIGAIRSDVYAQKAYEEKVNLRLGIDDIDSDELKRWYEPDTIVLPSKFSIKDELKEMYGIDMVAADQGDNGLCDTFGSLRSIETNYALKTGYYIDLSERHMDYMMTDEFYNANERIAGEVSAASDVFAIAQMFGCAAEEEIPYRDYESSEIDKIRNAKKVIKINATVTFPDIYNIKDKKLKERWINVVKTHVMKYGSLDIVVQSPNGAVYNDETAAYYYNSKIMIDNGGHAVSIVGWDDNYSKKNFNVEPKNDGAFICLNSWGEEWGEEGYFYVSYEAQGLLLQSTGVLDTTKVVDYNEYTYSERMIQSNGAVPNPYEEFATLYGYKFNKKENEEYFSQCSLAITLSSSEDRKSYVNVYLNPVDDTFDKDKLVYLGKAQTLGELGRFSISLQKPYKLKGDKFAIVFELSDKEDEKWQFLSNFTYEGNEITGNMYRALSFDDNWTVADMDTPIYVCTTSTDKISLDIKDKIKNDKSSKEEIRVSNNGKNNEKSMNKRNKVFKILSIMIYVIAGVVITLAIVIIMLKKKLKNIVER